MATITLELEDILCDVTGSDIHEAMTSSQLNEILDELDESELLGNMSGDTIYENCNREQKSSFLYECDNGERIEGIDGDDIESASTEDQKRDFLRASDRGDLTDALKYIGELNDVLEHIETSDLLTELESRNVPTKADIDLSDIKAFLKGANKSIKASILWDLLECPCEDAQEAPQEQKEA